MMELQHQNAVKHIDTLKKKIDEAKVALMDAKRGREEDEEDSGAKVDENAENVDATKEDAEVSTNKKAKTMSRAAKLARLQEIAKLKAAAETELESLKDNDPQALANLEKELQLVLQGANRWTDNIYICKSYLTKKRGMDSKQACKVLDITSAFDCKSKAAASVDLPKLTRDSLYYVVQTRSTKYPRDRNRFTFGCTMDCSNS